jgi:hypothetical protein
MPVIANIQYFSYQDGILTINMIPPTPIGGWSITWSLTKRFGSTDYIAQRFVSSGLNNVSGINITNSGEGIFNVQVKSVDTSGLEWGNYAIYVKRTDSGFVTPLQEGYMVLQP